MEHEVRHKLFGRTLPYRTLAKGIAKCAPSGADGQVRANCPNSSLVLHSNTRDIQGAHFGKKKTQGKIELALQARQ